MRCGNCFHAQADHVDGHCIHRTDRFHAPSGATVVAVCGCKSYVDESVVAAAAVLNDAEALIEGTVPEVSARLTSVEDMDLLEAAANAETAGKNRVTVIDAIDARLAAIQDAVTAEGGTTAE